MKGGIVRAGLRPRTGRPGDQRILDPGDVAAQTTRPLQNVKAIIDSSGASFDDVVMLRVYLTEREDFAAMNDAYGELLSANTSGAVLLAARRVFTGLPRAEMLVGIDAIAVDG